MEKNIRVHRVGAITAGGSMVVYGVLFLLHIFLHGIGYEIIFKLWPFMMIALGIEILLSNIVLDAFVYDKTAIFLMLVITFFALGMAGADLLFSRFGEDWNIALQGV